MARFNISTITIKEISKTKLYSMIAMAALATGAWEVVITRIASILFFHHITYIIIAICLFAFGLGALIARYLHQTKPKHALLNTQYLLGLLVLSCLIIYPLLNHSNYAWYLCLFSLPFLIFGCLSTLIWMKLAKDKERSILYAIDMSAMLIGLIVLGPIFVASIPVNVLGDVGITNHLKETVKEEGIVKHSSHTSHFARTDFLQSKQAGVYYIFTDGMFVTRAVAWDGHSAKFTNPQIEFLASMKRLAFAAAPKENIALLGAGAGFDIAIALQSGATHIDAIEINPATIAFAQEIELETGGVLNHPSLDLHITDARSFVRRSSQSWDHINLALLQTSPANGRGRQHVDARIITKEAIQEYRDHLKDFGIISIIQNQPALASATDNVVQSVFRQDLQVLRFRHRASTNPFSHLILVREEAFSTSEITKLIAYADSLDIELINSFKDINLTHIASDDQPYLFESGSNFPFHAVLVVSLTLLMLLLWRYFYRSDNANSYHSMLSFLTGNSMMSIQVLIIYRCQSIIGSPTIALATGLAAMMLGAGIGALISQHRGKSYSTKTAGVAALIGILVYVVFSGLVVNLVSSLSPLLAGTIITFFSAFCMLPIGLPFLAVIASASQSPNLDKGEGLVIAFDGMGGVTGAAASTLLTVTLGFNALGIGILGMMVLFLLISYLQEAGDT